MFVAYASKAEKERILKNAADTAIKKQNSYSGTSLHF